MTRSAGLRFLVLCFDLGHELHRARQRIQHGCSFTPQLPQRAAQSRRTEGEIEGIRQIHKDSQWMNQLGVIIGFTLYFSAALAGFRLVMRPLSVPAVSSMMALTRVGRPLA